MASQIDTHEKRFSPADYRVRLFLSVDLSGSTAFKNSTNGEDRNAGATPKWVTVFEQFYTDFPARFRTNYELNKSAQAGSDNCPVLWKAVGDELVFCGRTTNKFSIGLALNAFIDTLHEYRDGLLDDDGILDVKGAAWLAAFPEPNRAVQMRRPKDGLDLLTASEALELAADIHPYDYDFLGKAIDTGFRVASSAKPERFVLSVQLARLIAENRSDIGFGHHLHFGPPFQLKGVNKVEAYPSLYLDTMKHLKFEDIRLKERALLNGGVRQDLQALHDYLVAYCSAVGTDEIALPKTSTSDPVAPPDSYVQHRKLIETHLMQEPGREGSSDTEEDGDSGSLSDSDELKPLPPHR